MLIGGMATLAGWGDGHMVKAHWKVEDAEQIVISLLSLFMHDVLFLNERLGIS